MQPESSRSPDLGHASTGELVARLSEQVTELVKGEMELARAELVAQGKRAGRGAGAIGAGGVLAAYGFAVLLAAAIAALALVWPVWLAALVIGALLLIGAGIAVLVGQSRLRRGTPPVPEQAMQSVREDIAAVRKAAQR
jgi:hypothetical protein